MDPIVNKEYLPASIYFMQDRIPDEVFIEGVDFGLNGLPVGGEV